MTLARSFHSFHSISFRSDSAKSTSLERGTEIWNAGIPEALAWHSPPPGCLWIRAVMVTSGVLDDADSFESISQKWPWGPS